MIGSHTKTVIAPMKNPHSQRYRAEMDLPGKTMGKTCFASMLFKDSISLRMLGAGPNPASFGFLHVFPKNGLGIFDRTSPGTRNRAKNLGLVFGFNEEDFLTPRASFFYHNRLRNDLSEGGILPQPVGVRFSGGLP